MAAEIALSHDEILRRCRRVGIGGVRGFVGRETALHHDGRIPLGNGVDVIAETAQRRLKIVPGHGERDDVGRGFTGSFRQRLGERVDQAC